MQCLHLLSFSRECTLTQSYHVKEALCVGAFSAKMSSINLFTVQQSARRIAEKYEHIISVHQNCHFSTVVFSPWFVLIIFFFPFFWHIHPATAVQTPASISSSCYTDQAVSLIGRESDITGGIAEFIIALLLVSSAALMLNHRLM